MLAIHNLSLVNKYLASAVGFVSVNANLEILKRAGEQHDIAFWRAAIPG